MVLWLDALVAHKGKISCRAIVGLQTCDFSSHHERSECFLMSAFLSVCF